MYVEDIVNVSLRWQVCEERGPDVFLSCSSVIIQACDLGSVTLSWARDAIKNRNESQKDYVDMADSFLPVQMFPSDRYRLPSK